MSDLFSPLLIDSVPQQVTASSGLSLEQKELDQRESRGCQSVESIRFVFLLFLVAAHFGSLWEVGDFTKIFCSIRV